MYIQQGTLKATCTGPTMNILEHKAQDKKAPLFLHNYTADTKLSCTCVYHGTHGRVTTLTGALCICCEHGTSVYTAVRHRTDWKNFLFINQAALHLALRVHYGKKWLYVVDNAKHSWKKYIKSNLPKEKQNRIHLT